MASGSNAGDLGGGRIEVSDQAGHSLVLSLDAATGLPASATYTAPGNPNGSIEETYSAWRDVGGVKLPGKITLIQGGHHYADITVGDVSLNKGLTVEQISKKP
jgi:hypothetical protein